MQAYQRQKASHPTTSSTSTSEDWTAMMKRSLCVRSQIMKPPVQTRAFHAGNQPPKTGLENVDIHQIQTKTRKNASVGVKQSAPSTGTQCQKNKLFSQRVYSVFEAIKYALRCSTFYFTSFFLSLLLSKSTWLGRVFLHGQVIKFHRLVSTKLLNLINFGGHKQSRYTNLTNSSWLVEALWTWWFSHNLTKMNRLISCHLKTL